MNLYKLLGFFCGFLISSIVDTTLGELNEWAIVGAAIVVASLETSSKVCYSILSRQNKTNVKWTYISNTFLTINTVKIGVIYGLIVDAFKLGS
jgi:hypothetical protein